MKVTIAKKEVDFKLNNYALYKFGRSLGVDKPLEAIGQLAVLKEGYSFDGQERLAKLIHYATKEEVTLEEAFDMVTDEKFLVDYVIPEIDNYVKSLVDVTKVEKKNNLTQETA